MGIIAGIALLGLHAIDESNWAKDIKAGKAFQLPHLDRIIPADSIRERATFPTEIDILVATHYSSYHLAGYGQVIDHAHPGNVFWREQIETYANGYLKLTPNLQDELCRSLIKYTQQDSRFLKHGKERQWVVIEDPNEIAKLCHESFLFASNRLLATLKREMDSFRVATKYGRFRETSMQDKWTIPFVEQLESALFGETRWPRAKDAPSANRALKPFSWTDLTPVPSIKKSQKRVYTALQRLEPREPFELAWLREGDIVEAKYHCAHNGKYFD